MAGSCHSRAVFWRRFALRISLALFGVVVRALAVGSVAGDHALRS